MERPRGEVFTNFDGRVFKQDSKWLVTTTIPSIRSAKVVGETPPLKEGMPVIYDLVTILTDSHNEYEAINLRKREVVRSSKPTPKQRDRKRR